LSSRYALWIIGFVFSATLDRASAQQGSTNVVTYHYDTLRTGWNPNETVLTTSNVNSSTFGVLGQVTLDDQVDAQPLVVNNIVYIVTENNTVYAIDGGTGAILNSNNLGPPVQQSTLPGQCKNNGSDVGIQSTPVIDVAAGVIYVVTYTWENNLPVFRIHQLALSTLAEVNNTVISASHLLSDGQTVFTFNAKYQRQRAALLEANGNVYAAFSSFCDLHAKQSRGWVLGWQTGTLTPLAADALLDEQTAAQTPRPAPLSSIIITCRQFGCRVTALRLIRRGICSSPPETQTRCRRTIFKIARSGYRLTSPPSTITLRPIMLSLTTSMIGISARAA
jgi:hypothetical protein